MKPDPAALFLHVALLSGTVCALIDSFAIVNPEKSLVRKIRLDLFLELKSDCDEWQEKQNIKKYFNMVKNCKPPLNYDFADFRTFMICSIPS